MVVLDLIRDSEVEHVSFTSNIDNDFVSPIRSLVCFQFLQPSVAVDVVYQCAAGLRHLHALGIIHRDVRASNILIAGQQPLHVVVADFGVSHQVPPVSLLLHALYHSRLQAFVT